MTQRKRRREVDCLGLGIIPLDYLIRVHALPPPGGKADAHDLCIQGGGPIPNCLTGLSRLGMSAALISGLGDDIVGRFIRDEMANESIDTYFIVKQQARSDSAYGFVETGSGRRTIVLSRGIRLRPSDLRMPEYPLPRIVHLDGRDLDACMRLAKWGRRIGAVISFDVGSIRNDVSPIFPLVDHLVVSDAYALGFTRKRTVRTAIKKLMAHCAGTIVVTEGTNGATGYENAKFYHHPAFKVKVADTTGAGDSFHAGYLYALLRGYGMQERLRYGAAVAALKCMKPGARAGNPTLRQLNAFLARNPETYD